MTGTLPAIGVHHSPTLPSMSSSPKALGCFVATSCVVSSPSASSFLELSLHQAISKTALGSSWLVSAPARQAYSHSASVGRRYLRPVFWESQRQYLSPAL